MKKPTYEELEKKLKDYKEKLQDFELNQLWSIYSQSPIPTFILAKNGRIVEYNKAMAQLTGYKHEEVPDLDAWMPKIYPDEEYRNTVIEISRKSRFREIDVKRDEFMITRKDSEQRYVEFSVYDIAHKGELVDLQVVQGVDITGHKKAEAALRESEERFRNLMEHIPGMSIQGYKTDGTVFYWNKASEKVYGYTAHEAIGKNLGDLIVPPDLLPLFKKCLELGKKIKKSGEFMPSGELMLLHKNGNSVPVFSIHTGVYIEGKEPLLFCIDVDLSELKRAEEALRKSEKKYHTLIENTNDIIYSMNAEGIFTYISPQVKRYGFSPEEFVSHPFLDFLVPEDREKTLLAFQRTITTGEEFPSQFRIMDKEGCIHWVEEYGRTQFDEKGRSVGLTGALRDITERKKAEEKLKLAQKELEIKTNSLEETNTALKVLLKHQDTEKNIMEKNILLSLKTLVLPYLEKIKIDTSDERQKTYINIIETNLTEITKPFANQLTEYYTKFTPTEIQIANLIRENKTAKDIAGILDISVTTVFFHRRNIRIKLDLKNKKVNLRSYLRSFAGK